MPGIVGLITKMPRQRAEEELLRMVAAIRHDSCYVTGTWIDESLGVYVGWSARKNSFADGMPLSNEKEDIVLVFSGEEYPEPGIADRLRQRGHTVAPGAASYLVHLCEEDPTFPAGLNGWFHGLVANRNSKTLTLFNDRYGLQRIYYHESKEAFYFATEAKAILEVRPELRRADPRGLGEFIACGCVLENRTLFEGVSVLPPASIWIFRNSSIERKGAYFEPQEWENQDRLEPDAYYKEIREVFTRNLPRYFDGGEKIGVSLTGGLDTRMIMAWHKSPKGTLPCYSFGGMFRDCEDVLLARQVARLCGQSHEVIEVGKDFLSRFPHYAERTIFLSDGCASVGRASDLFANERAAQIAPVRMTGNYGSEILRRMLAFRASEPPPGLFRPEFLAYVRKAKETYARLVPGHPLSFIAFRQTPWHHYGLLALEQTQISMRSPYLDNDLVRTAFRAPNSTLERGSVFTDAGDCVRLVADGDPALGRIRTDRGLAGNQGSFSKAVTRVFLESTFKAEYTYDYGMPQWLAQADHLVSWAHFERLFLGRHKFNHFRVWYRDALSTYIRETLLDPRALSRPYLEGTSVEAMVRSHLKGTGNYTTEIHTVLTLELIHRVFLDPR